ncbi:unnamed protein product [Dovyalis caffra]|uniref:Uncharacterized protein n=1 Tax=Dovyalis caffra TaxID=77055 RepID=A0AAV1QNQ5_9ROSI|nr:unnamed protein product [Dovyalis caffra]
MQAGSFDPMVRVERSETVLFKLARVIGVDSVYAYKKASHDKVKREKKMEEVEKEEKMGGIKLLLFDELRVGFVKSYRN